MTPAGSSDFGTAQDFGIGGSSAPQGFGPVSPWIYVKAKFLFLLAFPYISHSLHQ